MEMPRHQASLAERLQECMERNHIQESYREADHVIDGECLEMCPQKERNDREMQRRLHILEMMPGSENTRKPKADPKLTIKEYSRPAAGKQEVVPRELRPPHILLETVQHIVDNILTRTDIAWSKLYSFAFDRLRAVRQDLVIQRAAGQGCAMILEQCVRFHVYAAYRLCSAPLSEFDPKINSDHTRECLKRLLVLYQLQDDDGCEAQSGSRAEMEALNVLFNLGSLDALIHTYSLPGNVRSCPRLQNAVALSVAFLDGNFIRMRRLAARLGAVELCCLHAHLPHIQRQALLVLSVAYSSKNLCFPLQDVAKWLMCDAVWQAEDLCRHYGLAAADRKVQFRKGSFDEEQKLPKKGPWITYVECHTEVMTVPQLIRGGEGYG